MTTSAHKQTRIPIELPLNTVLRGDCRELLPTLPPRSVDLIFADPPYNLQLRNELLRPNLTQVDGVDDAWDQFTSFSEYDQFTREWLLACRKVLKDDGTLWVIGSYHCIYRIGAILQDLGYWILNDVTWIKCLSAGTRIYAKTQNGEMPMTVKDMVRLNPETVQLWNGTKWTQVRGWTRTDTQEGMQIELRSGERLCCTSIHQWPTQRGLVTASDLQIGDIISTCQLPEHQDSATFDGLPGELLGWFIGLYIGAGTRHDGTISIAGVVEDHERFERVRKLAQCYQGQCTIQPDRDNGGTIHLHGPALNAFLDQYIGENTATGKHLSVQCWQRSNRFLRAVLDGYLSGVGQYDAPNRRWRLALTCNYAWEADLRTLCARLNIQVRWRHGRASMNRRESPALPGEIRFEQGDHHSTRQATEVVHISHLVSEPYWDVSVQDEPHLFALASGVLTHNSNPMPNFRGTRFCNAHETLLWVKKSERQSHYTFNYRALKAGNDDLQVRSDWYFPICTGEERLKINGEKAHATQKPEALLHRIIRACTNPGDVVLDPFFGTGTTGAMAKSLQRHWIGIEREEEYAELATQRIARLEPPPLPDAMTPPPLDAPKIKIPFMMLLEHGLLASGAKLRLGRTKFIAVVQDDGTVACDGHRGSIHKVGAQCLNQPSCNGWEHWYYHDPITGDYKVLDTLREPMRRVLASG